jgi:hypothetical protein
MRTVTLTVLPHDLASPACSCRRSSCLERLGLHGGKWKGQWAKSLTRAESRSALAAPAPFFRMAVSGRLIGHQFGRGKHIITKHLGSFNHL